MRLAQATDCQTSVETGEHWPLGLVRIVPRLARPAQFRVALPAGLEAGTLVNATHEILVFARYSAFAASIPSYACIRNVRI